MGVAVAAIGMTWSVTAGAAVPTFAISPNPASAMPGGDSIEFVLSVSDAPDPTAWVGFVVGFGRSSEVLPPGDDIPPPEDLFVTIDATSAPVAGSLLGDPEPSSGLDLRPNEYDGVACQNFGGCVSVSYFSGLNGNSGELLKFRMKLSPDMPVGSERIVSFSVDYTGVPFEAQDQVFSVTAIPEPSTYHLLAAGLLTLLLASGTRSLRGSSKVS